MGPIGLSTGCFYRERIEGCLVAIREADFGVIEICSFPAHLDYHDLGLVTRTAARLRELEIEPYSFHAPFAAEIDITALDSSERQFALAEIERALNAAAELGARHFVLHPGPESGGGSREQRLTRMENAAATLNALARRCATLGVRLVLENMLPHLFSGHIRDLMWLLGALETPDVGVCLDTGHAFLSGDLANVARKLSGHLTMVHASDNRGVFDDHLPPGDGHVPWPDLLRQLDRSGFAGAIVLEIAAAADMAATLAGATRARNYLQHVAGQCARHPERSPSERTHEVGC